MKLRRRLGSIVYKVNTYWVGYAGGAAASGGYGILFDGAVTQSVPPANAVDSCMPISPAMGYYQVNPLQNVCLNFNFFKCVNMQLDYTTGIATSTSGRMYIAYTKDPDYMERLGAGSALGVSKIAWNVTDLVGIANCEMHVPWQNWTYRIPLDQSQNKFYTANQYSDDANYAFGTAGETAVSRQEFQGMFYIFGQPGTAPADGTIIGDIFITSSWLLWDLGGTQTSVVPSLAMQLDRMGVKMTNPPRLRSKWKDGHNTPRLLASDSQPMLKELDDDHKSLATEDDCKYPNLDLLSPK